MSKQQQQQQQQQDDHLSFMLEKLSLVVNDCVERLKNVPEPLNITPMAKRPSLQDIATSLKNLPTKEFYLPKIKNKGKPGLFLEEKLGIPQSSECLDCTDGELKCFPLKPNPKTVRAKESVAVTMVDKESLVKTPFNESRVYKKLSNTLFVPYSRKEDIITYKDAIIFTTSHPLFKQIEADYNEIRANYEKDFISSSHGVYLQTRTKGAGHGSTSRAFYLRPQFLNIILSQQQQQQERQQLQQQHQHQHQHQQQQQDQKTESEPHLPETQVPLH